MALAFIAPLFDEIDLLPRMLKFNGMIHDNSSVFRGDPSPEVDRAWDLVSAEGREIILVPATAVLQSNMDPSVSVKAPPAWDYGDNAYIAQVDVFHQIHCLNELRKEIDFDYYYRDKYPGGIAPKEHKWHKKHCLHILLQNLMCHADVDSITHKWIHYTGVSGENGRPFVEPIADFNVVKQCRNFNGLLAWVYENAVQDLGARWHELKAPKNVTLAGTDGYFPSV
jgi:Mycotoxin biosynthesis protein UstYa